jgi:hypothetical protein
MEMILDLAMTFWQWTVLIVLVLIGFVVNKFDKEEESLIEFKYPEMPKMQCQKCNQYQLQQKIKVSGKVF